MTYRSYSPICGSSPSHQMSPCTNNTGTRVLRGSGAGASVRAIKVRTTMAIMR